MESPETAFHSVLLQLLLIIALCAALVPRVCVFERGRDKGLPPGHCLIISNAGFEYRVSYCYL